MAYRGKSPWKSWGEALWSRVDRAPGDACWLFQGPQSQDGYGAVWRLEDGKNKMWRAHRLAWATTYGDPGELFVCHRCDTPLCVRPDHLFLGTCAENLADMRRKERQARGETHGNARLTIEQAREIRRLGSEMPHPTVAKIFGVSREHVRDIVSGKKWAHA